MTDYDYSVIGSRGGLPMLYQNGPGARQVYPLRFSLVWAASENAAKQIQIAWRREQAAQ